MNFLFPAFMSAAALVGLPLLLHLLRLQPRKRIPFPSLHFLGHEALRDSNRQRFRRWLTLLLRCLAILLVIAAFARPFWPLEHSDENHAVVVVIDNSFSMQATGRKDLVESWLAPQIEALRRPDQLGALLLHPTPAWLAPLADDLEAGRTALKKPAESYEITNYRAGLDLAAAKLALSTAKKKTIILAGDQQRLGWSKVRFERTLPPGIQLHIAPVAPAPARQAAITLFKATRLPDSKVALQLSVRGYTPERDERSVTFWSGTTKLASEQTVLTAGKSQNIHAEATVPDATAPLMLHATIDGDDLPIDDIAYAALAGADDRRVLLAPAENPAEFDFLAAALTAVNNPGSTDSTPGSVSQSPASVAPRLPAFRVDPLLDRRAWAPTSVALLRGSAPFQPDTVPALDAFLSAGGSAWIICNGSPEQAAWLAAQGVTMTRVKRVSDERLQWRDLQLEHPLFAPFAGHSIAPLLTPVFHRGYALDGAALEPLARWPDRSIAVAEVPVGRGRLLVTGFRETRADSTFPTGPGYVPFVHQAVTWLSQNQSAAGSGARVGDTILLPGEGTWRAIMTARTSAPANVNGYVVPTAPGLYAFEQPNAPARFYAVNLDTAESDLAPWPTPDDFQRLVSKEPAAPLPVITTPEGERAVVDASLIDERQVWWWLLAAALAVLMAELALANRTVP